MPALFEETVLSWIRSHDLLPKGAFVLCALSGGADSVAMTRAMCSLREELEIGCVAAAHYNHGLRGKDSDCDQKFCMELCEKLDIPLFYGGENIAEAAVKMGLGIEAAGRRMRYDFLMKTAFSNDFTHVATAHTAEDNAETLLLNLTRGSGLTGLSGIPPQRKIFSQSKQAVIIRPMLSVTKERELQYLEKLGQDYCMDASNEEDHYRRNRIRHHVLPQLTRENPALMGTLTRTAELLKRDMEYLEQQAELAFESIATAPDTVSASSLAKLPAALSGRVVRLMCKKALDSDSTPDLSSKHIAAVLELCCGSPSARTDLPCGLTARRIYGNLCIRRHEPSVTFSPVSLSFGETKELPELGMKMCWAEKPKKVNNLVYSFCLNSDTIKDGLTIRPRIPGDSFQIAGKRGTKTLHSLFIDHKIPREERRGIPVLADEAGVVAVGGFGVASRCVPAESDSGTSFQIYRED